MTTSTTFRLSNTGASRLNRASQGSSHNKVTTKASSNPIGGFRPTKTSTAPSPNKAGTRIDSKPAPAGESVTLSGQGTKSTGYSKPSLDFLKSKPNIGFNSAVKMAEVCMDMVLSSQGVPRPPAGTMTTGGVTEGAKKLTSSVPTQAAKQMLPGTEQTSGFLIAK